jgi:RNA polymerase sigma factor (sigma-70 family)
MPELPENHLALVAYQVRRFTFCTPQNFDDLFQAGCFGLINACRRHDGREDPKSFPSYASKYIRGEILHYQRSQIGRTDYGRTPSNILTNAISLDIDNVGRKAYQSRDPALDEWDAMSLVWQSQWERSDFQRKCVELVLIKGLTRVKAAEILDCGIAKVARFLNDGIDRLHNAYLSAVIPPLEHLPTRKMQQQHAQFLLREDSRENRPWQLFIDGALVRQANGTNPRVRQIDPIRAEQLAIAADRVLGLVYEIRIIKLGVIPSLIVPSNTWALSFDNGATQQAMRVLTPIRESPQQNLYWIAYLEEQKYV